MPSRVVTGLDCSARLGEVDFDVATFSGTSLSCSFGLWAPLTTMMLPFFCVLPLPLLFFFAASVRAFLLGGGSSASPSFSARFALPLLVFLAGSVRAFLLRGGSSPSPSYSSTMGISISVMTDFISLSLPRATTLHWNCSKPFTLQKVSGTRLSDLGLTIFFICTMERESSSGQQTRQCVGSFFVRVRQVPFTRLDKPLVLLDVAILLSLLYLQILSLSI